MLYENIPAVQFFFTVSGQWIVSVMGPPLGLCHARLEASMNIQGIRKKERPALLAALQVIERAVRAEWSRQAERNKK